MHRAARRRANPANNAAGGGRLFRQQECHELVELLRRDQVAEVAGHQGELRRGLPLDLILGDREFPALAVCEDERLALLAALEAREDVAVLQADDAVAEGEVDVAAGVKEVLGDAVDAALADAVELRADLRALPRD